ncbi:MAG: hypothetical protein GX621_16485 [Pirellulaceae bacterium]|nr:hypothetical protein [Pirellulaceae bacterium]
MSACRKPMLIVVVLAGGMIVLAGCVEPVSAPTSYGVYNCKAGTFRCEYPDGWEVKSASGRQPWAKFTRGPATIHVGTSMLASMMAGPGLGVVPPELDESLTPVALRHDAEKEAFAEEWSDFQEQSPVTVKTQRLGDARKSEFTAAGTFGGKIHGYRVTILGHDHRLRIVCTCPESDWTALQPAFDRIIESFERGYVEQ